MKLKDRFRQVRLDKGLNLKELAQRADLSFSYISGIEHGRAMPSLKTAAAIAEALEMSLLELLNGIDFAGTLAEESEALPAPLQAFLEHEDFHDEIDEHWVDLLSKIQLRGYRPPTVKDWMGIYFVLKKVLEPGKE